MNPVGTTLLVIQKTSIVNSLHFYGYIDLKEEIWILKGALQCGHNVTLLNPMSRSFKKEALSDQAKV
jgi:hypothetical protein